MADIPEEAVEAAALVVASAAGELSPVSSMERSEEYTNKVVRAALEAALPLLLPDGLPSPQQWRDMNESEMAAKTRVRELEAAAQHVIDVHDEGWPYALGDVQVNRRATALDALRDVLNEEKP